MEQVTRSADRHADEAAVAERNGHTKQMLIGAWLCTAASIVIACLPTWAAKWAPEPGRTLHTDHRWFDTLLVGNGTYVPMLSLIAMTVALVLMTLALARGRTAKAAGYILVAVAVALAVTGYWDYLGSRATGLGLLVAPLLLLSAGLITHASRVAQRS